MRVLIAYGSKRGGTAGLAEMIGDELEAAGLDTVVKPARDAGNLDGFDSVVIAGALYAKRWHQALRPSSRSDVALTAGLAGEQRSPGRLRRRGHPACQARCELDVADRRPWPGHLRGPSRAQRARFPGQRHGKDEGG